MPCRMWTAFFQMMYFFRQSISDSQAFFFIAFFFFKSKYTLQQKIYSDKRFYPLQVFTRILLIVRLKMALIIYLLYTINVVFTSELSPGFKAICLISFPPSILAKSYVNLILLPSCSVILSV